MTPIKLRHPDSPEAWGRWVVVHWTDYEERNLEKLVAYAVRSYAKPDCHDRARAAGLEVINACLGRDSMTYADTILALNKVRAILKGEA